MSHDIDVTVRFCETDAAGHVNNTSYFIYLEEARGKFFENVLPNNETSGRFIIAGTECNFLSQAYFNQRLTVSTWVSKIGTKSFRFKHTIKAADTGVLIAEAEAAIVCFNYEEQKSEPIPLSIRQVLEEQLMAN
ncbi:acyl-CoA thioesterase [Halobacillus shinanisalinarum]|uniref:Acyl-CoA thioesterase n=1 Tax=Halobacillus shinanisalinarum TaxID=2932258 RepID=A0ABY4H2U9_9BACI|nr:thioesterase family protein [Halobacillus shinanisalinarum]UOQ94621.1 acyl-CoA thioesterase [Halobacillus shinanisalinarum]